MGEHNSFRNPFSLALTGGIACGKSTVAAMLQALGLVRIDSDQIARDVVEPGTVGLEQVVERFGNQVLLPDGRLDRRALGAIVFASTSARRDLEKLLHPLIWERMAHHMESAQRECRETVFEIPLLFENNHQDRFSTVWVVACEPDVQLARLRERDGWSQPEAEARLASQMSVGEKASKATYVLYNNDDSESLKAQVLSGLKTWRGGRQ